MRKFITKNLIDKHADCGILLIEIDRSVVVTGEAREHAMRRGVTLKTVENAECHMSETGACTPEDRQVVAAKVRATVIAELGFEPVAIDLAIANVLARMKL
jgi:hypothetical protein